jgi:integrase
MRQGELLGLQRPDIDFQAETVTVARTLATVKNQFVLKEPKSKPSRRTIKLPPFALAALQAHRAAMLTLRHTVATLLLARGNSVKAVSQRLGHATIEITLKHYAHVLPEDDDALAHDVQKMIG